MTAELTVLQGGSQEDPSVIPGSRAWSKKVRSEAKRLAESIETTYMELAEILYRIDHTHVDNDPKKPPVYTLWGYLSFKDWAQAELGIHHRKAESLRRIYYRVNVELTNLDVTLKKRLLNLGWSKVRELVRPGILTLTTAKDWVDMAEKENFSTVERATIEYLSMREDLELQKEIRAEGDPIAASNVTQAELDRANDRTLDGIQPTQSTTFDSTTVEEREIHKVMGLGQWGESKRLFNKRFAFYPDQLETVKIALQRAQEISSSNSSSHNLSLICLDFLSNNDFAKSSQEQKLRFIAKMERLIGYKLVAVDPATKDVLYGISALELAASKEDGDSTKDSNVSTEPQS